MADIHIALVLEVEKYPELYNFKLSEYSRKDITERTWAEVSNKTQLPVNECKEKWRNIRSSFIRSLKTPSSGSKPKKPYYLKEYLSFVLPYVKPINESHIPGNIPTPPTAESDQSTCEVEAEILQANDAEEEQTTADNANEPNTNQQDLEDTSTQEESAQSPRNFQAGGKRRRKNNEVDGAMLKYLKKKIDKQEGPKPTSNNQTKMNHFFLSIINEFDDMTDQQLRKFKIKTLQLIDDLKQGRELHTPAYIGGSLPSTSRESSESWSSAYSPILSRESSTPLQPQPSPVHMPYDLSSSFRNSDFSYENL